jgi:hypothetical protein
MLMRTRLRRSVYLTACTALALATAVTLVAQPSSRVAVPKVTTPETFFGHQIGADYVLPNYTKFSAYVHQLDQAAIS